MHKQISFCAHENILLIKLLQQEIRNNFARGKSSDSGRASASGNSFASGRDFAKTESISNSKIRRLIMAGQVSVNGKQIFVPSFNVHKGSFVAVKIDEEKFFAEKKPDDTEFTLTEKDVLYEDDVIIIVNKPARFPTEQTITGNRANLHEEIVRYLWEKNPALRNPPYVGIMHRLDRDTSGAILFTKSRSVNKAIFQMFEERTIEKVYRAVAEDFSARGSHSASGKSFASELATASGSHSTNGEAFAGGKLSASGSSSAKGELPYSFSVKNYLARESSKTRQAKWHSVKNSHVEDALFAHTDFTILRRSKFDGRNALFIEARPHTGRTHQIRVHLSESGMAIFGDTIYGGENAPRLMLHAYSLAFTHPVSGEKICVTAPLPDGF